MHHIFFNHSSSSLSLILDVQSLKSCRLYLQGRSRIRPLCPNSISNHIHPSYHCLFPGLFYWFLTHFCSSGFGMLILNVTTNHFRSVNKTFLGLSKQTCLMRKTKVLRLSPKAWCDLLCVLLLRPHFLSLFPSSHFLLCPRSSRGFLSPSRHVPLP